MRLKIKMIALTTVLILSMTGQCFAAVSPFTDINAPKSKDKVVELYDKGVLKGAGNGIFNPDGTLTAAQGVQLIVNAFDAKGLSLVY